jgi:hypothetical protein
VKINQSQRSISTGDGLTSSSPCLVQSLILGIIVAGVFLLVHPRLGIPDVDAYSYIVGAYSFADGNGYRDLLGVPITHWPPGYSLILASFGQPLAMARSVNSLSIGLAASALYVIFRFSQWSNVPAVCIAVVMSAGMWRVEAAAVKPDILNYAIFLLAAAIWQRQERSRLPAYLLLSLLIPIKLISVVFLPAAVFVDLAWHRYQSYRLQILNISIAFLVWLSSLGIVLWMNQTMSGQLISKSHERTNITSFFYEITQLLKSIPRLLLFTWYGSIKRPEVLSLFIATVVLAGVCLLSLRLRTHSSQVFIFGIVVLFSSLALGLVQHFDFSVRLTGYGLFLLPTLTQPPRRSHRFWIAWAGLSIATALWNRIDVNNLGGNDPRYELLAKQVKDLSILKGPVASNSFHILDVHAHEGSDLLDSNTNLDRYGSLVIIDLPPYDAIASTVWPYTSQLSSDWHLAAEVPGGRVYLRRDVKALRSTNS